MTKTLFSAAFVVSVVAGTVSAQSVNMHYLGTGEGRNVRISLDDSETNVFAGSLRHRITSSDSAEVPVGDYTTFCVDLAQYVSRTSSSFDIGFVGNAPELVNGTQEAANRLASAGGTYQAGNRNSATADQLALWEIVYDFNPAEGVSSLDITSGRFSATKTNGNALWSSVSTILTDLFATTSGDLAGNPAANFRVLVSEGQQDQLIAVPSTGPLALAALGGLLTVRRKR